MTIALIIIGFVCAVIAAEILKPHSKGRSRNKNSRHTPSSGNRYDRRSSCNTPTTGNRQGWNGFSDPDDFPTDGYGNNGW